MKYFEQSCERFPHRIAVSDRHTALTFSELRKKAQAIAALLRTTQYNQPVGVFANRTVQPIIRYLAVLYSGNFYVPLDPELPAEKLQSILQDTGFPYILGDASDADRLAEVAYSGVYIDTENASLTAEEKTVLPTVGDDDPVYMVYTSGSTGKPKGVLKSHASVCSYIEAFCDTFSFDEEEVIGNQTPFFFDASAKDFFLMLKTGAELHVIPTEKFSMPTELIEYMNQRKITYACWVPTAISIVAQMNPFSLVKPEYLRRLFFVGEVMPVKHLNKWRCALPDLQYVNLYGQSELAGICCYYEVSGALDDADALPLGIPLANSRIYLMDADAVITEPHKTGELYIVSSALALGYYRDAEKTAQSFLWKDFGNGPERCFRTGDLAYYDANGNLMFASRSDYQIKHMGHRIELGEIETVADSLPQIERCCCIYNPERRKIVLFCSLENGKEATEQEIKSALKAKLSAYMVPGKVKILERLPVNANGKIDRQTLKGQL